MLREPGLRRNAIDDQFAHGLCEPRCAEIVHLALHCATEMRHEMSHAAFASAEMKRQVGPHQRPA